MTNGMAIKLSLLGFTALASLAVHQAVRANGTSAVKADATAAKILPAR